jgi:class 3 adenylate cyclase/tetratricopeptide (TPR) repeat protein
MKCPRCKHENQPGAKFCQECSAPLARVCSNCGCRLPEGAKFCPECGKPAAAATLSPAPERVRAPESYTPKHLAEKILSSKSALEGERKQVTVLFVDTVESSRLAQRMDPEAMHEVMDRVLRLMAESVHRYEGTVNQFLGDGLMALFGAPVALEDHALRAVQAALGILETVNGLSEELKRERGIELRLRLGLNSGPVVVGRIGDDLRMDYTAVGDTTNLAARMQTLTEPGTILVSDATHRMVEGYVRSEPLGLVQVKGRTEPVSVFRILGRRRRRSRIEVSADAGLTTLVGREREREILRDLLARAKSARGQVVGLVGEAGVGKSRLVYEFRNSVEGERLTWLEGHCVPYGQSTPFLPVLEVLSMNFQIEEGDNRLQIEEKLRRGMQRLDVPLEGVSPYLRELYGLTDEDDPLRQLDPKEKRQRTFEAIRALTVAASQRRPHVIVIEDLQWIDQTSEDYFAFLVESLAAAPILFVTMSRPGSAVRWADKPYYTQIGLGLLENAEVTAMVTNVLGTDQLPPDLVSRIQDKAEGNPLFVEEIVTALRERGLLVRHDAAYTWAGGPVVEVPGTAQDIIRARLDRQEAPVKRTAQAAAVIGREFGLSLLKRVCELPHEVDQHLSALKRAELIHETRFFPEPAYIFKHTLIQEVIYQSLLAQRRRELHGAIGRAIEELHADRLEEQAPLLAYHYEHGARPEPAVRYALAAGDRAATQLYANAEAATYYERALAMARTLPPSPDAERAQIDATLKLAGVEVTRKDLERERANLHTVRSLAEQLDDQPRLSRVLYWLGRIEYVLGNPQGANEYAKRSLQVAERLGDEALAAAPVNLLGRSCFLRGELREAGQLMERSVGQLLQLGNRNDAATSAAFAGCLLAELGEFERASVLIDQGTRLAREIENPFVEAAVFHFRGVARCARGEWPGAVRDLAEARRISQPVGDLFRVFAATCWEGRAEAMMGDLMRARSMLEEALALAERLGTRFLVGRAKAWLADCLVRLGETDAAIVAAREAIRLGEALADRFTAAYGYRALAEALFRIKPLDWSQAEDALRTAIQLQQELSARPEVVRSYVSYAAMLAEIGQSERSSELMAKATDMSREMGMVTWDFDRTVDMS